MQTLVIALASDHAGVELKAALIAMLHEQGTETLDLGTHSAQSVDYPDYGHALAHAVLDGRAQLGIGICGSGVGISIALNRHAGIRAALCSSGLQASLARRHNDANILCLGARLIGQDIARDCVSQFLAARFEGGRHQNRIEKIELS